MDDTFNPQGILFIAAVLDVDIVIAPVLTTDMALY